jgi:hypothetical protein
MIYPMSPRRGPVPPEQPGKSHTWNYIPTLEPAAQSALDRDVRALIGQCNRSDNDSMVAPSEYLEVVITRK